MVSRCDAFDSPAEQCGAGANHIVNVASQTEVTEVTTSSAQSACDRMAEMVCAHLDAVEQRLLERPSLDDVQEIQNELELAISLLRGSRVSDGALGADENALRPIRLRLRRLSALLEQALAFCEGWQSLLNMESGYNPAGAWNDALPARGLLDHRG
ncbi:hypothetical protein [uncultured Paludibaculum sp.]|uniref:hypothetical protein n=1 Tax=uncultured Paludibaculum sp. TaxID=1765020 RepID=UPI002AAB877E|nr:hypothetical protein [uncultured Paludibaculum sp.]